MFSIAWVLLPDFALIVFGLSLRRYFHYSGEFWAQLERLVYNVMFPALLFRAVVKSELEIWQAMDMLTVGGVFTLSGLLGGLCVLWWVRAPSLVFASSIQTAFRFNTYIGIAIVDRLAGSAGLAAFALLVGTMVPIVNAVAVWFLARHNGGSVFRELLRNPLILATLGGLVCRLIALKPPDSIMHVIDLFAHSATLMGLLSVGASLQLKSLRQDSRLIVGLTAIKMLIVPAVAWWMCETLNVTGIYRTAAMGLAILPTASSAYILAVRMGGAGNLVASIITFNIFVGLFTVPMWIAWSIP